MQAFADLKGKPFTTSAVKALVAAHRDDEVSELARCAYDALIAEVGT